MKKSTTHTHSTILDASRHSFEYKELTLDYLRYGSGRNVILCFHGFGRKAEDFEVFTPLLRNDQCLLSINLFAHECSLFPSERIDHKPLAPEEWKELLEAFLVANGIKDFHLIGYSMGGRVAMKTLELMHDRIKSVLLIAPDGLKVNLIYRFASGTFAGKLLYRSLINHPKPLFATADILHKMKLLSPKLHRFVYVHQNTKEKRQQVYDAWLIYKNIFPNLKVLSQIIRTGKTFHMIFGKYDSIITPKLGKRFSQLIGSNDHYYEIESGHQLINDRTRIFIEENELWPR